MDKKHFLILLGSVILAIFVSIFFSFWVFFGHHRPSEPRFAHVMIAPPNTAYAGDVDASFKEINKMMERQQKIIDKMNKDFANQMVATPNNFVFVNDKVFKSNDSVSITSEEFKDKYEITINLKPFNNDENNIKVNVKDKTVIISADYKSQGKKKSNSASLYQSFTLSSKIDPKEVKKDKKGDLLIITIPKKINKHNFFS